ncbi:hypothetical protein [Streptomyces sp. uw30]|uniref:hypothetical protein n=1 Tax=Streptomyces sp. uw30 TaxID=1828179 RepID=UPI0011CE48CC|nr:hypothetical protein [Streptomyces sp. uw30]
MNTQAVVAIAGAAVSAVAAGVAVWQAVLAKQQAQTAQDSALSARRQADAAEAQVQLMQRQIDGEERERHDTRGPIFTLVGNRWINEDGQGQLRATLRLLQKGGPALSSVKVTVSGNYVEGVRPDPNDLGVQPSLYLGASSADAQLEVCVGIEYRHVSPVQVSVRIDCVARDSASAWTRDLTANVETRPAAVRTLHRR